MSGRGIANPRLWAWKQAERRAEELDLKLISEYEKGVCAYCPQVYCEPDKTFDCAKRFYEVSENGRV